MLVEEKEEEEESEIEAHTGIGYVVAPGGSCSLVSGKRCC